MSISIRRSSAPITSEQVHEFEEHFNLSLPDEYRAFLLRTNGGIPSSDQVGYEGKSGPKRAKLLGLYGLGREGLVDAAFHDLLTANMERPHAMPITHLFIGRCETAINYGQLVLACGEEDAGKVFYRPDTDDDRPTLYPVAE